MKKSRSRKPTQRRRPTICVCVIARDEERFLGDCLASVQAFADELVVLDTGSTDRTVEIAASHGARVGSFAWRDDFSAARNAAIDLATSDWILMLDADERLVPESGPVLRAFLDSRPSGAPFYAPRIENRIGDGPEDVRVSFPNRLFQRSAGLRYAGSIHEDLVYLGDPKRSLGLRVENIRIMHLGYMPDIVEARGKFARNRTMLLRAVSASPNDPLPWYYLGMDRVAVDEPAEAAEYFRKSLACKDGRPNWTAVVEVYSQLVWAYSVLKDDEQLRVIVEEAERAGLLSAGARCELAQGYVQRGMYAEAVEQLVAALAPGQPIVQVNRPGIGGWITRRDLARVYEHMGNAPAALAQLERVLGDPEAREREDIALTAVRLALQLDDMPSLSRCLESVAQPPETDLEGNMRWLELRAIARASESSLRALSPLDRAVARGDWKSAGDAALSLPGLSMADAARLLFVAARLDAAGSPAAALKLLEHLYDTQPALPQLHWVLSKVFADLGRFDDALASNEILRQLVAAQKTRAA